MTWREPQAKKNCHHPHSHLSVKLLFKRLGPLQPRHGRRCVWFRSGWFLPSGSGICGGPCRRPLCSCALGSSHFNGSAKLAIWNDRIQLALITLVYVGLSSYRQHSGKKWPCPSWLWTTSESEQKHDDVDLTAPKHKSLQFASSALPMPLPGCAKRIGARPSHQAR